jgi:hypothetical protein
MVPGSSEFNEELDVVKLRLDSVKGRLTNEKGILDVASFCEYLDKILTEADKLSKKGDNALGHSMCDLVMVSVAKIAELGESSVNLQVMAQRVKSVIDRIVSRVAPASQEAAFILKQAIRDASNKAFQRWEEFAYYMIQCPARLATAESIQRVEAFLGKLSDRITGRMKRAKWHEGLERVVRYEGLSALNGKEATKELMEESLGFDDFRLAAADSAIKSGDYAEAVKLCEEKLETLAGAGVEERADCQLWHSMIYKAASEEGDAGKIIKAAAKLVSLGEIKYYFQAEKRLTELGAWDSGRRALLYEIEKSAPIETAMDIFEHEGDGWRLVNAFMKDSRRVFEHAENLALDYPAEAYRACMLEIKRRMALAHRRAGYKDVCGLITRMYSMGGKDEAMQVIAELKAQYKTKVAIIEELDTLAMNLTLFPY